ncbi:hypothetical protein [Geminocystis sp. NIES-3709]|uniref:hypothetical protein n=1 Tax=Geminocystis sp. NIES-3709 TaxID=1617448 RepID=UPI0005FCD3AE|nr:hypothetical protein [Geminocystis sp. NIES-3709]BAQ65543.1 hypothetical protein GM3709_2308 [Geminocystis sp. NIES-3709]
MNNQKDKICTIVNGQFAWELQVDEQRIYFQGSHNADYFAELYTKLGYQIVKINWLHEQNKD